MSDKIDHVRLVAHVPLEFAQKIKHEALDRYMTIGQLLQYVWECRPYREPEPDTQDE